MENVTYRIGRGKVIIRARDRLCDKPEELLSSDLFLEVLKRCLRDLSRKNSSLLNIFADPKEISEVEILLLIETLTYLVKLPADLVMRIVDGSDQFFHNRELLDSFVEFVYNYWRGFQRVVVCDFESESTERRPYRTFNNTAETLMHVIRSTYRDVRENISGLQPRIYRQVRAGAEIAAIALPKDIDYPLEMYRRLNTISVIRQVLIYPPLIINPPRNTRKGSFVRVFMNPLENAEINKEEWLCYPAKVGPLMIMIYFSVRFFELGFSLCNLFDIADNDDLQRKPDAIFLYGVPPAAFSQFNSNQQTIFFDDTENDLLIGAIPDEDEYGYFGYLKKMALTLHNIKMMKIGRLPFHGALCQMDIRDHGVFSILLVGDTGAGKSETLEALRLIGEGVIDELTIIADDMGSLEITPEGNILGYGTETGAFVRLDDLQPGYAFGQIDRTIIMNPNQTNARVVLPVTTYDNIIKGVPIDIILYANNYEEIDEDHPIIQRFETADQAINIFREGTVMSKGTTTSTGLVHSYFANIFGPLQYRSIHEVLARRYFSTFFEQAIYVGQLRTRLGIDGMQHQGPETQPANYSTHFVI